MSKTVLIAGGSGLIGSALTRKLSDEGWTVRILTTNERRSKENGHFFYWNIQDRKVDETAFDDLDVLINLAGASIAGGLWTRSRKKELLDSRVDGTKLLFEYLSKKACRLKTYFGASAVGYYGNEMKAIAPREMDGPGSGFLADICYKWEEAHKLFEAVSDHVLIGRISNVLSMKGGFMTPFLQFSKMGLAIYFTKGKNIMSWISQDDLVEAISHYISSGEEGVVNLCTGNDTWVDLQSSIYKALGKSWLTLTIPRFALKLGMGQFSSLLLSDSSASPEKLLQSKAAPMHQKLDEALIKL